MSRQLPPVHPGEILREEFLIPNGLTAGKLAKALDVPRTRIERIVDETTGITANTALRLGKFFGTTPDFWLNLQSHYDLLLAKKEIGKKIAKIGPLKSAAA
jgi:addiction module HigA family antidote